MVTVYPLGIVRYRCNSIGFVTSTKDTRVQNLVTIGSCVRPPSCAQNSGTGRHDDPISPLSRAKNSKFLSPPQWYLNRELAMNPFRFPNEKRQQEQLRSLIYSKVIGCDPLLSLKGPHGSIQKIGACMQPNKCMLYHQPNEAKKTVAETRNLEWKSLL